MTELVVVLLPSLVGVAIALWAGVVVRRVVSSRGGAGE